MLLEENAPDPTRPTHGLLLRVDRTMRVLDTVAELPAEHSGIVFQHNDGAMYLPQPFSDDPKYGVSVDGSLVVLVTRRTATSEDGAQFTIVGLRNGTERLFARTIAYQPRRLLNRTVESAVAFLIGDVTRGAPRSPITADSVRRRLYRPAFLPPVSDVRVGRDGTIWLKVRFGDSPANADEWMQLSSRGQPQRRVVTPAGFRLLEADRRMVWGTCADSMDVPEVRRYAVD